MEYWDIGNIFHCRWRYSLATLEGLLEEKSRDHEERDPHVFCAGKQVGSGFFETEDARIAIREKAEKRWRGIGMWGALGKLTESWCDPFTRAGSFRVCANFSTDAKLNHSANGEWSAATRIPEFTASSVIMLVILSPAAPDSGAAHHHKWNTQIVVTTTLKFSWPMRIGI